ncbi:hypothetical protein [Methylobacterium tardum]|uniref:hypothetical protein n=1 Tax=Methylobacterium tardum TaxID=374432 RepID=UPI001EDF0124|nr:hypothetical protein [Methylobacterium tardum]URD39437.1 hypothetical protein M6G65_14130 [Methylobacterium tardum]
MRRPWTSLHWHVHTIEQRIVNLFEAQFADAGLEGVGALAFIEGWMRWKAESRGFGYVILDVRKAEDAATLARNALHLGLLSIDGRGADFRLGRIEPNRPRYQRLSYGGGLVLQGCGRHERTIRRHARAAAPIIDCLLREIMALDPHAGIPHRWFEEGFVPRQFRFWTIQEAFGILRTIHEDWTYEAKHVLWTAELRCHLIYLGGGGRTQEPEPPAEDTEALAGLAA